MRDQIEKAPHKRNALYGALNPRFDVRNIMSRSSPTIRGRLSCGKAKGAAKIESPWEAVFCLRAEASADVRSFETNPFRFDLSDGSTTYTPDAEVDHRELGNCLVEIKPRRYLRRADTLARLTAIRREVERKGYRLLYSTEVELNRREENARMRDVKIHRCTFTPRQSESLAGRIAQMQVLTIAEAERILGTRAAVMHLLAVHCFYVDYRRPFSHDTLIARNPLEANHAVTLFSTW